MCVVFSAFTVVTVCVYVCVAVAVGLLQNRVPVWTEEFDEEGDPYYFNHVTGDSLWEKPDDFDTAEMVGAFHLLVARDTGESMP